MTNEEYVRRLGILYDKVMSLRDDRDYVVNQPQMDKFVEVVEFFMDETRKQGGELEPIELSPHEEHGGLTATFILFSIRGATVQRFCSVMSACTAISIDPLVDGEHICISCTIPNVFVHK